MMASKKKYMISECITDITQVMGGNIDDIIKYLTSVPIKYAQYERFFVNQEDDYEPSSGLVLWGMRPENSNEEIRRLKGEQKKLEKQNARKQLREEKERALYSALKEKYGK